MKREYFKTKKIFIKQIMPVMMVFIMIFMSVSPVCVSAELEDSNSTSFDELMPDDEEELYLYDEADFIEQEETDIPNPDSGIISGTVSDDSIDIPEIQGEDSGLLIEEDLNLTENEEDMQS